MLPLRKWLPDGAVKAVILALHGFNDYSDAFEGPGEVWANRGIATYAFDQRGFGAAPGHGLWAGAEQLAGDAITGGPEVTWSQTPTTWPHAPSCWPSTTGCRPSTEV